MEKEALQNTPRLELFNQILNDVPKIVNLNDKSDFETLCKTKVRKNVKDIVLSGEWMKKNIRLMENLKVTYSLLEELAVAKQHLYKI